MQVDDFDRFDTFRPAHGLRIRWAFRGAVGNRLRGTVLLLGGRTEFIEKYGETAEALSARGFAVLTLDWRGQGGSERLLPNRHKGHVNGFDDYLEDLDRFMDGPARDLRRPPLLLLGHSMGGHLGLRYLRRRPGIFDRAVLTSPMVDIHVNPILRWVLRRFAGWMVLVGRGAAYVPGTGDYGCKDRRFAGNRLTSDRRRFERCVRMVSERPFLALGGVTFGWVHAAFRSIDRMNAPGWIEAVQTPFLIVCAGADRVVSVRAQRLLCRRSRACRMTLLAESRHEVLMETDETRRRFWKVFDRFTASL